MFRTYFDQSGHNLAQAARSAEGRQDRVMTVLRQMSTFLACGAVLAAAGPAVAAAPGITQIVRGPVAYRLTGYQDARKTTSLGDYRYAIVFKLNRDPQAHLPDTAEEQGRGVTRGRFALDGYDIDLAHLYSPTHPPVGKANCYLGYVDDENPSWLRKEGRKRLGTTVSVRLQPLDKHADGKSDFGPRRIRHPHLQQADVSLKSAAAKRSLAKIGC
jgi:hypothetical protein